MFLGVLELLEGEDYNGLKDFIKDLPDPDKSLMLACMQKVLNEEQLRRPGDGRPKPEARAQSIFEETRARLKELDGTL